MLPDCAKLDLLRHRNNYVLYQKLLHSCDSPWYTHVLWSSTVCLMHVTVPQEPAQQPSLPGRCPQMVAQHDESQTVTDNGSGPN